MSSIISRVFGVSSAKSTTESRSSGFGGVSHIPDVEASFLKMLGIDPLKIRVTSKTAMSISAFYGCVNLLSDLLSTQPYSVFKKKDGIISSGDSHPLDYLIHNRPNAYMSSFVFRKAMFMNMLVYGYAIAQIIRDGFGNTVALVPHMSKDVQIYHDEQTNYLFFKVISKGLVLDQDDVIFLKDVAFDGMKGHSIVDWQSQTIKLPALTRAFAEKNFEKGSFMSGFVTTPLGAKDGDAAQIYKERIIKSLRGDEFGGFGLAVLGQGADYKPVTRSFVESQVIEILNYSDKDIAKMFRTPLIMIGDTEKQSSFGRGIDSMYILLTNNVIIPKAVQFEQEVDYKCLTFKDQRAGYYTKMNFGALLRGDALAQAEVSSKEIQNGIRTINEVRALHELSEVDGGDRNWIQQNMMPVDKVDEILKDKSNGGGNQGSKTDSGTDGKKVPADELA